MKEYNNEIPLGLGLGLSMNEKAMSEFAGMNESEKEQVIDKAKNVQSKQEMQHLIQNIADQNHIS
ncbi:MAG TPA: hypothetical protein VJY54_04090 [Lachnospiraceae bacterium]|nr:hypothetical protein [Lachnospiraceae bacterium]